MSCLILPRRHYSQPQGLTEIDYSHPLLQGAIGGYFYAANPNVPEPTHGLFNKPITYIRQNAGLYLENAIEGSLPCARVTGTVSVFDMSMSMPWESDSSKTITFIASRTISNLTHDLGNGTPNGGNWSWLDAASGVLRISAFTTYDTTNVISTPGTYTTGLIWRPNNTYQTIYNGRYSQSGSATRQAVSGNTIALGFNGKGDFAGQIGGFYATVHWWLAYARDISENEAMELHTNPWQIFKAK